MQKTNYCECVTPDDGITHYSKECLGRCVIEVPFGFAIYIRDGAVGTRKGLTNQLGAFQWLQGYELSEIKHYETAI